MWTTGVQGFDTLPHKFWMWNKSPSHGTLTKAHGILGFHQGFQHGVSGPWSSIPSHPSPSPSRTGRIWFNLTMAHRLLLLFLYPYLYTSYIYNNNNHHNHNPFISPSCPHSSWLFFALQGPPSCHILPFAQRVHRVSSTPTELMPGSKSSSSPWRSKLMDFTEPARRSSNQACQKSRRIRKWDMPILYNIVSLYIYSSHIYIVYIYSLYICMYVCVYGLYYIHMIYVREDVSYADVPGIPAIPWTVSASWTSAVGLFGWTMSGFTTMMSWWFYQEQWGLNGICSWFMRVAKLVYNVLNCWVD